MQVRHVLDLFPDLRLRAGGHGAGAQVLWVHVIDQPDMSHWLRQGTLVLTTGIGWGSSEAAHRAEVREIAAAGAAALVVATGRFLHGISSAALSEADELGLPLIEAPFSLPFIDMTSAIQRLLVGEQYEVLERADRIHRALTRAALTSRALGPLLGQITESLDCDAAVYRERGAIGQAEQLAQAGDTPQPETVVAALRHRQDRSAAFSATVDARAAMFVPVRLDDDGRTLLALFARDGEFGALQRTVAEHAATVIALQLAHQRELADVERRVHQSFVDALLSGAYQSGDIAAEERARLRGIDPAGSFRVVIARAGQSPDISSPAEFARRQDLLLAVEANLAALAQQVATTSSLNRVILLWRADARDRDLLGRLRDGIVARMGSPVVLAASSIVTGLGGVQRAGWEAERLLGAAPADSGLLFYEDQLVLRLLQRNDPVLRRELREVVVGKLLRARGGPRLVETLEALVQCGYRQQEAAEQLGVHRNTMLKRIARIEQLIARPLGDPETRTLTYLSLALRRVPD